jgi:hypothetical protein
VEKVRKTGSFVEKYTIHVQVIEECYFEGERNFVTIFRTVSVDVAKLSFFTDESWLHLSGCISAENDS